MLTITNGFPIQMKLRTIINISIDVQMSRTIIALKSFRKGCIRPSLAL